MTRLHFTEDFFGDPFILSELPLPRQALGYAVQMLDTDTLLDRSTGGFLSIRALELNGLFETFEAAHAAASQWLAFSGTKPAEHRLAIVPAGYDEDLRRHVLIYGVLCGQP